MPVSIAIARHHPGTRTIGFSLSRFFVAALVPLGFLAIQIPWLVNQHLFEVEYQRTLLVSTRITPVPLGQTLAATLGNAYILYVALALATLVVARAVGSRLLAAIPAALYLGLPALGTNSWPLGRARPLSVAWSGHSWIVAAVDLFFVLAPAFLLTKELPRRSSKLETADVASLAVCGFLAIIALQTSDLLHVSTPDVSGALAVVAVGFLAGRARPRPTWGLVAVAVLLSGLPAAALSAPFYGISAWASIAGQAYVILPFGLLAAIAVAYPFLADGLRAIESRRS
jgi:hypothetical protein